MELAVLILVIGVVYAGVFLLIRANVRRLVAMHPRERSQAARRQLIATTIAALAMVVVAFVLASD